MKSVSHSYFWFQEMMYPYKTQSQEDLDRISRVTSDAPIMETGSTNSLGRRTIASLQQIERNRQLHLAQQGSIPQIQKKSLKFSKIKIFEFSVRNFRWSCHWGRKKADVSTETSCSGRSQSPVGGRSKAERK